MRSPSEMDILQIDITARCFLRCSNCTRGVAHYADPWEMDLLQFEHAAKSLRDWLEPGKVVGIIGGEPTMHSRFEEIANRFSELVGGPRTTHGREPITDLAAFAQERLFDRSNGRGLWTSFGPGFRKHIEVIMDVFSHWNLNTHETGGRHQAMWIHRRDYCEQTGMSDDEWLANRDKCWVQNMWSATVNDRGAYFCEVAGTIDRLLYDGKHAWTVDADWWKRSPDDFTSQIHLCDHCSLAQPCPSSTDSESRDIVSGCNLVQLEAVGSPAVKKNKCDTFDGSEMTERREIDTKDNYVGAEGRVLPSHDKLRPKRVSLVTTCAGYAHLLKTTLKLNHKMFDEWIVATSQFDDETMNVDVTNTVSCVDFVGDAAFNKGHLINTAIECLNNPEWIVLADADVILHPDFGEYVRSVVLNPGCLYWAERYDVTPGNLDVPVGQLHGQLSKEPNGFFQMFHRDAHAIRHRWPRVMSENFCSAGGIDSWFMQQWPADKRIKLPLPVRHITDHKPLGANWNGNPDRPCWRQIGMLTARGMALLDDAPEDWRLHHLKLTDTLYGESVTVQPWDTIPVQHHQDGTLTFDGRDIGHCHIHVAAWSE